MTRLCKCRKHEDRAILVFVGTCMTVIMGTAALTFDLGRLASTQTNLQAYTPVVTAELVNLTFDFAMLTGPLLSLAASDPSIVTISRSSITLPALSTSAPAEDLAAGAVE